MGGRKVREMDLVEESRQMERGKSRRLTHRERDEGLEGVSGERRGDVMDARRGGLAE